MKQIINKHINGIIANKYYLNHLGQKNGVAISYNYSGSISFKYNYLNDKIFGLDSWYFTSKNNKLKNIVYHL